MDFQMLDQYVHEVCKQTKCFMGGRGEWIVYLDGVIYAKIIPENALQKQKTKSLPSDKRAQDIQEVEEKIRNTET
jgi:hypothetical protein